MGAGRCWTKGELRETDSIRERGDTVVKGQMLLLRSCKESEWSHVPMALSEVVPTRARAWFMWSLGSRDYQGCFRSRLIFIPHILSVNSCAWISQILTLDLFSFYSIPPKLFIFKLRILVHDSKLKSPAKRLYSIYRHLCIFTYLHSCGPISYFFHLIIIMGIIVL